MFTFRWSSTCSSSETTGRAQASEKRKKDGTQPKGGGLGTAVNAGFVFLRGSAGAGRSQLVLRLVDDAVRRGLIEFYLRWNNIPDQYGYSHEIAHTALDTSVGSLRPKRCAEGRGRCLRVGLLPHAEFPRHGDWRALAPTALVGTRARAADPQPPSPV
ncbi:hypothetical protein EMIHUDRAFT_221409 [Emiliania huxleyi CCMP1516]|uniref:Uncharacterized protein n=2 Tax=Emiliania huxleyi TaxID=2903 RepID=A0A0D3HZ25_EMIH1|nr:hypothetical protein EMIHUDRAFT_221409 [Emiliania huxleyi CCMP1516]EOD04260.1 hypothetical protein EMIHUDRAFT_221409 [Emiliania huxleyi CCMP1516]|eukprot:XP_005756689.1 hypothetical protein EMIHUDRAFT_221409 [Emiliania huxleyi CCMP1516]